MEKMCDQEHLNIVDAEALQLARDYMLYPEQHMKHPKRFSNSVTNTVGMLPLPAVPDVSFSPTVITQSSVSEPRT